ncbi:MAG: PP2C family protein-serine/threonine phosphatase [Alkalispirochaeta sp.]
MLIPAFASPLWPRLVVALAALLIARFARVITRRRDVRPFTLAALFLVIRDLGAVAIGPQNPWVLPYLRVAGETVAYMMFLFWSGRFRISNRSYVGALIVSIIAWGIIISDGVWGRGIAARVAVYGLPPVLFVASLVAIFRVDRFVFSRGYQIEDLKPWMQVMLAVQTLLYLVIPLRSGIFEPVVAVLPMVPFIATPLFLVDVAMKEERVRIRSLQDNARSIFDFLTDVGRSLGSERDPENILHSAIETMTSATDADAAAAVLVDGGTARVTSVVGLFPPPVAVPDIIKSKQGALRQFVMSLTIGPDVPLWGKTLQAGTAIHVPEAQDDPALAAHAGDRVLRLRSMLVLPLEVRGTILGLLSVVRRGDSRPFSSAEFDHARTMTNFVAVTLDNYYTYRIQRDVEIAAGIQKRLQAPASGSFGGIDYAGVSRPVRGMSGDYYDVIPIDEHRTMVVICDVSGKGVPAALVMVMIRTIAHLALNHTNDAGEILAMINQGVSGAVDVDRFATATVVVFDTASQRMSYANAAHHPMLLLTEERGQVEAIDAQGLPIGIEETEQYRSRSVEFPPGATVVLFTDGVVEAFNPEGEEFGDHRLYSAIRDTRRDLQDGWSTEHLLDGVMSRVDAFVGGAPQHDDISMLVCSSRR